MDQCQNNVFSAIAIASDDEVLAQSTCSNLCITENDDGGDKTGDDSFPNPDELMKMTDDANFDWRRVSKILKGPICWKCFYWSTFFECQACGRSFHRHCAFMGKGFPQPVFDKSVDEAMVADYGRVNLLKCSTCIISEETQVTSLSNHTPKELNGVFYLIAQYIHTTYADVLEQLPADDGASTYDIAMVKIKEKASREEYKTLEGFHADFRMIRFNIVKKHGRESEGNEVAHTIMGTVETYLRDVVACSDCTKKYFATNGNILNAKEYSRVIREPCVLPHLLIWVKEGLCHYRPAKILAKDSSKNTLLIQYFGEKPGTKEFYFPSETASFRTFSLNIPGRSKSNCRKDCTSYVKNLRAKFQDDEAVVIPVESEEFDGDLDAGIRKMFPSLNFEDGAKKDKKGVPERPTAKLIHLQVPCINLK